jgi:hypothetical protein
LNPGDRVAMLWVLVAVIAYSLLSFTVHLIRDHLNASAATRRNAHKIKEDTLTRLYSRPPEEVADHDTLFQKITEADREYWRYILWYKHQAGKIRVFTIALDSGLPLVIAAIAMTDVVLLILQRRPLLRLLTQLLG